MNPVKLTLLVTKKRHPSVGETHHRSGLNWGHRNNRDRNESYIPVPADVRLTAFFPPSGQRFTVHTDDNHKLVMTVQQDRAKALVTPHKHSILGLYLRRRMGLPSGVYVTRAHLEGYGRTDIVFRKVSSMTYHLDFSPFPKKDAAQ